MKRSTPELVEKTYKNKCDLCGWKGNYSYFKHCKSVKHIKAAEKVLLEEERKKTEEIMSLEHEDDVEQPNNSGEDEASCDVLHIPHDQNENPQNDW